jgi:uncharacterized membrane protein YcaP (DUF421 family)
LNPYAEILLRAVAAFLGVLIVTRLVGKSQVGQLTISDYVNGIVIGSIAAGLVTDLGRNPGFYGAGLFAFAALTIGVQQLALKNRTLRKIFSDEPTVVVHNGKILEQNMARMRYNVDDLLMQLREKGAFNIADVEFAVAEPNGNLSVLLKAQKQPVTPQDLGVPTSYQGLPSELVVDGQVIKQNLVQNNLSEEWLYRELEKQGVTSLQEVVLASLDTSGHLYVDRRRDTMDHYTDTSDTLPRMVERN